MDGILMTDALTGCAVAVAADGSSARVSEGGEPHAGRFGLLPRMLTAQLRPGSGLHLVGLSRAGRRGGRHLASVLRQDPRLRGRWREPGGRPPTRRCAGPWRRRAPSASWPRARTARLPSSAPSDRGGRAGHGGGCLTKGARRARLPHRSGHGARGTRRQGLRGQGRPEDVGARLVPRPRRLRLRPRRAGDASPRCSSRTTSSPRRVAAGPSPGPPAGTGGARQGPGARSTRPGTAPMPWSRPA